MLPECAKDIASGYRRCTQTRLLFLLLEKTRRRARQTSLTLLALNPHRVSRDQPSGCRQFRRSGRGRGHLP
jgi:hypothetical protein